MGDIWFESVNTVDKFECMVHQFKVILKLTHRKLPKVYLEDKMNNFLSGANIVVESYNNRNII